VAASIRAKTNLSAPLSSPDGRQTRIDFRRSNPRRSSKDFWQTLAGWLKSNPKEQEHQLEEFTQFLEKRKYSVKTCNSYIFMLRKFFDYLDQNGIQQITLNNIEDYNYDFFVSGRYSRSYQLQYLNGLALYLEFAHGVKVNLKGLRKTNPGRSGFNCRAV
jgi:hypothetical protein